MPRASTPLLRAMSAPLARAITTFSGTLAVGLSVGISVGIVATSPSEARASSPYLEIPDPTAAMATPAYRYANMTDDEAYAELDKRGILYSRVTGAPGVRAPIRLTGRLHGVLVRSALPPEERATSMFEICDARLALSLDDFSAILARHDVDEVVHYTMYRPNVPQGGPTALAQAKSGAALEAADAKDPGARAADAADAHARAHGAHGAKRRAYLDDKASKGAKGHGATFHASGDSRHKELVDEKAALEMAGLVTGDPDASAPLTDVPRTWVDGASLDAERGAATNAKVGAPKAGGPKPAQPGGTTANAAPFGTTANAAPGKPSPGKGAPAKGAPAKAGPPSVASSSVAAKGSAPKGGKWSTVASHQSGRAAAGASEKGPSQDDDLHGKWAPPGTRHPAGLAIDVGSLKKKNGKVLSVAADFQGKLGDRTCGPGAPVPEGEEARELRSIVCEAHDAGVFTYTLTPNYNAAHRDHFHMEIKPGVVWFLYH